jgi:biopolymer transport protein TolQ
MELIAMNPIFEAYYQSDLFGKAIFLSLLFLSIVTWAIFLKKWLYQRELIEKAEKIQESFYKKKHAPLNCDLNQRSHPFVSVYEALKAQSLELLNKNRNSSSSDGPVYLSRSDIDLIDASINSTISHEVKKMEKNLFILSTIVSLAPFLGLLGTVWGILLTFTQLQSGASSNAHSLVMDGLAMALGTTVVGLLVAIPALLGFNYLKSSTTYFAGEIEDFSELLLVSVEMQYRKVDVQ